MPYENAIADTVCSAKICLKENRAIAKGNRIFHSNKTGKYMHEACAAAQFGKPSTNPAARLGVPSNSPVKEALKAGLAAKQAPITLPMPLTDKERADMLQQAQKEVRAIFGLDNSASEYATYVSMLFHARLQAQEQAFQLSLSRYIQAKKIGNIEKVQQAKGL